MAKIDVNSKHQQFVATATKSICDKFTEENREGRVIEGSALSEECENIQLKKTEHKISHNDEGKSKNKLKEEITEFELISPCPVQECLTKDKLYKWTHKKCGETLTLDAKGMVNCHKCGKQVKYVDWPFNIQNLFTCRSITCF